MSIMSELRLYVAYVSIPGPKYQMRNLFHMSDSSHSCQICSVGRYVSSVMIHPVCPNCELGPWVDHGWAFVRFAFVLGIFPVWGEDRTKRRFVHIWGEQRWEMVYTSLIPHPMWFLHDRNLFHYLLAYRWNRPKVPIHTLCRVFPLLPLLPEAGRFLPILRFRDLCHQPMVMGCFSHSWVMWVLGTLFCWSAQVRSFMCSFFLVCILSRLFGLLCPFCPVWATCWLVWGDSNDVYTFVSILRILSLSSSFSFSRALLLS